MDTNDPDLSEYYALKRWNAGVKPPAVGRAWRRSVHDAAAAVLPVPVMTRIDRVGACAPPVRGWPLMLKSTLGFVFVGNSRMIMGIMAPDTLDTSTRMLAQSIGVLEPMVIGISLLSLAVGLILWTVNGE